MILRVKHILQLAQTDDIFLQVFNRFFLIGIIAREIGRVFL